MLSFLGMKDDPQLITESVTKQYLEGVSGFRAHTLRDPSAWFYKGQEELVLTEGKEYTLGPVPQNVRLGKVKHCFSNAYHLAVMDERYAYCEGYATHYIPTYHAWNVDRETALAFDITWAAIDKGKDLNYSPGNYIGIEIPIQVYEEITMRSGTHGCIDAWNIKWPMLRLKLPDFTDYVATDKWLKKVFSV